MRLLIAGLKVRVLPLEPFFLIQLVLNYLKRQPAGDFLQCRI